MAHSVPWGRGVKSAPKSLASSANLPERHHLLDTSLDCVKNVGVDGSLQGMNPDGMCLLEIDDFATVRGTLWWDMWPEPHRLTVQAAVAQALKGNVARFSADCPTAKGTPKHWDVLVSPVYSDSGDVVRLLSVSRDVSREVLLAGERALVASELAHRIKNLFAIVDGIVGLTARTATDTRTFALALRSRISGLGRSLAYIYSGKDAAPSDGSALTVHGLMRELLQPYAVESGVDVVVSGDDHNVSDDAITPIALIVNELATNALKYGALVQADGSLSISTKLSGDTYELQWIEKGSEEIAAPTSRGFGTTLVDRTVTIQLGGKVARNWTPRGLELHINLPTRRLA